MMIDHDKELARREWAASNAGLELARGAEAIR
jgi:hypothetical protein